MVSIYSEDLFDSDTPDGFTSERVAWTKGSAHLEVAELLGGEPLRVTGDLDTSCVTNRVDLLVTKRFPRSLLVPTIVPVGFDASAIRQVVVAVGFGPHTPRAVRTAERVAHSLGVTGKLMTAYASSDEADAAHTRLSQHVTASSGFEIEAIETSDPRSLTDHLSRDTLLVHGAGGGSFLDRHFKGTGSRLTSRSQGCVLVVKDAPQRCFQVMLDPTEFAVSPELLVGDALQLMAYPFAPVVIAHRLVGIVRVGDLIQASPGEPIGDLVRETPSVEQCDPAENIDIAREDLGPGPVPVIDDDHNLIGVIT
ncbi:MAG: CBS domain-containing protein [Proteobacteria bacterium]|nr:CBS domain-containing protein [Pseudomonadota bacterium]